MMLGFNLQKKNSMVDDSCNLKKKYLLSHEIFIIESIRATKNSKVRFKKIENFYFNLANFF